MPGESLTVKIYAWPERTASGAEVWHAECVTFNLVSTRDSFDGVLRAMRDQIVGYVEEAHAGDSHGLIPRPSPWRRRALYWFRYRLYRLLPKFEPQIYRQDSPIPSC